MDNMHRSRGSSPSYRLMSVRPDGERVAFLVWKVDVCVWVRRRQPSSVRPIQKYGHFICQMLHWGRLQRSGFVEMFVRIIGLKMLTTSSRVC